MDKRFQQKIGESFEFSVLFQRGLFHRRNPKVADLLVPDRCKKPARLFIMADENAGVTDTLRSYVEAYPGRLELAGEPLLFPGGENLKQGLEAVLRMADALAGAKLCRHSYVLAAGGGALLDTAGLAAALVHRGLRLVRIPTTTLSQCDSGVGVKNGINYAGQKNFLGTFAVPFAVLNDFDFLRSLPEREWRAGLAEAFKVAIIKDAEFFDFLVEAAPALAARDQALMEESIVRCAELHLRHIREGGDPFERGTARPLDFGHWAAHELERRSGWSIGHGDAVAIGVVLDSLYAAQKEWIREEDFYKIRDSLAACGFATGHPLLAEEDGSGKILLQGLEMFREHLGGELTVTYPKPMGHRVEVHEIDLELMSACLGEVAAYAL